MKKMLALVLVLSVCCIANAATVTFELDGPIYATAGDLITINIVVSGGSLLGMDALVNLDASSGTGSITGCMDAVDAGSYGWDTSSTYLETSILTSTSAEFGGTIEALNAGPVVGYLTVLYNGGTLVLNLTDGESLMTGSTMDGDWETVYLSDSLTIIPEPATIALLCLGGLLLRKK